jgi:hypothetical protein
MGIYSNELIAAHYKAVAENHRTFLLQHWFALAAALPETNQSVAPVSERLSPPA